MIQSQMQNQPFKFSIINFSNPNSSFHKYFKDKSQTIQMPESIIEDQHRFSIFTEGSYDNSEAQNVDKKGKITKIKDRINSNHKSQIQKPFKISETYKIIFLYSLSPRFRGTPFLYLQQKQHLKTTYSKNTENQIIKAFLKSGEHKKNFSRHDFTRLFNDVAADLSRQYFSGFQIIHDLMISEKIQDVKNHIKYISKFYNSTYNKQELEELKLQ
ncbi:unnamed protein product [Paramecium octaurelia]|uniref:Uncharacterized protein n=1 Tax=Paramecium octaurelia TaxID=43137 RepID=A0A8S1T109_PAROT|nr:unnamed protein product [Paramecium octaurelia]